MIRCTPVDGSPAFEVADWVGVTRLYSDRDYGITIGASLAASYQGYERLALRVCGRMCRIEPWRERAERLERELAATFAADTTWPLPEVLAKLAHAADLLFDQYNYDGHGYEEIVSARDAARALLTQFRQKAQR